MLVGGLVLVIAGRAVLELFTSDPGVVVVALLPLVVAYSLVNGGGIVMSAGMVALRRSTWTLGSVIVGHGLLALAMFPVAGEWGLTGLWTALTAGSALILVVQLSGFHRHS
ncbi:hypothetical protein [Nonomuraea zeae]|uniref:Uncharacterized protein n=1 Tax=Nonomuraea zeae TaxID=1642303 RepID=A0A5S4G2A4_9ACTN|nr:hypothetical protein [Nonomuraea zeae]TMR27123.1 hypothetical protein ETD85_40290 [Nonomuraea zeae]